MCGGTAFALVFGLPERVYPRVCGGTYACSLGLPGNLGLSPRVRGNLNFGGLDKIQMRSIPACAGNPLHLSARHGIRRSIPACAGEPEQLNPVGFTRAVYPRVCGGTRSGSSARSPT